MLDPPETLYARSGDVNIAYRVAGEGDLDLVWVPNWLSNVDMWQEEPMVASFFDRLASFSRLIVFDRRGSGLSDPVSGAPTLEERMDDIRAVMDAVGSERAAASPGSMLEILRLNGEIDVREVLPTIGVPTLILHRREDRVVDVENARYLVEHIPGARLVELPGEDHVPMVGDQAALLDEAEEFLTGVRPAPEPDRILATVLFTDIVGSTERAAGLGDRAWRDLLGEHDRLVRRELARYRGREIKRTGDGFLATFDGPARGIRCAVAAVEALARIGVEIRAGLHTGEIEVIGDDVGGMAVHIGARVGAEAGAGEVLVSGTVRDLVVGSGLRFEDRGERALRGVPGEWRLFAVAP